VTPDEYKAAIKEWTEQTDKLAGIERRDAMEAVKLGTSWGRLAVAQSFIFNAGALIFLPHLSDGKFLGPVVTKDIRVSAWIFTAGALASALACLAGYLNGELAAAMYWKQGDAASNDAAHRVFNDANAKNAADDSRRSALRYRKVLGPSAVTGIAFAVLSWVLFIVGALRLAT
jgi:hypothetical protein